VDDAKKFYDREYEGDVYAAFEGTHAHPHYPDVRRFIDRYALASRQCVEIGCGRGLFQDLVDDYTGVDYSDSARKFLHKKFVCASATSLPLPDNSFDAAWSFAVLEHIPEPEPALAEMRRVLRPGGLLLLSPAWQCRPWAADGYPVRPYSDFGLFGKLIKASIPIRNSVAYRSCFIFPRRVARLAVCAATRRPMKFRFRRLKANYEKFWMSDSDACSAMDPYEAILWFRSRGDTCLDPPTGLRQFFFRTGPLVLRIQK
jgi:SAM-dependent methyltransferase